MSAQLRFARAGSNTILSRAYAKNPLKLLATRGVGPVSWVYAATYGGGIVGGDEIALNVHLEAGARAVLTTQSSTKVYRSLRPARQHLSASIENDALLVVAPDPVVCFAGADFSQVQEYELGPQANLVLIDWITSGRHATGERWAFRRHSNRIDLLRAGRRCLYDTVVLDANDGSIANRFGAFDICLTAVVTGPLVADEAAAIVTAVSALGIDRDSDVVMTAWPLPRGGALMRMAGVSVEQIGSALRSQLAFLAPLLGEDPWSRKW